MISGLATTAATAAGSAAANCGQAVPTSTAFASGRPPAGCWPGPGAGRRPGRCPPPAGRRPRPARRGGPAGRPRPGRGVADVVGARLEGRAPERDPLARQVAEQRRDEIGHPLAAPGVDLVDHAEQAGRGLRSRGGGEGGQTADVLGQAAAAVADARGQERTPDPRVHAHRVGQRGDVTAGLRADVGHRVDERHLGRQERVGGPLDQLGGDRVGGQQRDAGLGQRPVDLADGRLGGHAGHADHDPVRTEGVVDGAALAQELGIPRDLDRVARGRPAAEIADQPGGGAGRDGGLAHEQRRAGQVRGERGDGAEDLDRSYPE